MKVNVWHNINYAQMTHPLTSGLYGSKSKDMHVLKVDILNTFYQLICID